MELIRINPKSVIPELFYEVFQEVTSVYSVGIIVHNGLPECWILC